MSKLNTASHYDWSLDIPVIDVIDEVICELKGSKAFNVANALKYLIRAEKKGQAKSDYKKVIWYFEKILEDIENEEIKAKNKY